MQNAINWFELPATDFERAVIFYEAVLAAPLRREIFVGVPHAIFSSDKDGMTGAIIAGALVVGGEPRPSQAGPVIYLNAGDQLAAILGRVEAAGGAVLTPPTQIGPEGQIAIFRDSEGNRVGLHQGA